MSFLLRIGAPSSAESAFRPTLAIQESPRETIRELAPGIVVRLAWPTRLWSVRHDDRDVHLILDGYLRAPVSLDSHRPGDTASSAARELVVSGAAANGCEALSGHFVLCVIDAASASVRITRDRLGGRVAYIREGRNACVVASSARAAAPADWTENRTNLANHFALARPDAPGLTAFEGVGEIKPGESIHVQPAGIERHRPDFSLPDRGTKTDNSWSDTFAHHFETAVAAATDGHDRVAVMLSGGLDSVPILACAAETARRTGGRVTPLSWTLPSHPQSDETPWIQQAADAFGLVPAWINGDQRLPFATLDTDCVDDDFPAFNAFRGVITECYRQAAELDCSVILNGNQGDVLYAQRAYTLHDAVRRGQWRILAEELKWIVGQKGLAGTLADPALRYFPARWLRRRRRREAVMPWLTPAARASLPERRVWPPESCRYTYPDHAVQLLGTSMTAGPDQENAFARRCGIDRREPFQDEALVRLMLTAPVACSIHRGESKRIMRAAMAGRIPDALRLKPRTGLLTAFLRAGWRRHRRKVAEILRNFGSTGWSDYVDTGFVERAIASDSPDETSLMVVCQCLGHTLWRQRLAERSTTFH